MDPSPDACPTNGVDEWGAVWENIGVSQLGQVKDFPLKDWNDIRAYCRQMANLLGRLPAGGFIPRWYTDPAGAGHRPEAIDVMCEEFLRISRERYGNA
jgi:hypothetical protein